MIFVGQQAPNKAPESSEKHRTDKGKKAYDGSWWEATEIIAERKNEYKVSWADIDPKTGKRYQPCWVGL